MLTTQTASHTQNKSPKVYFISGQTITNETQKISNYNTRETKRSHNL